MKKKKGSREDIMYLSIEEVKAFLDSDQELFLDKYKIKKTSLRYKTFFKNKKSLHCNKCGKIGDIFGLTQMTEPDGRVSYHFNLYHTKENGKLVLLTKDHIIPKSKGGKNHISNLQTMCKRCNTLKGNKLKGEE